MTGAGSYAAAWNLRRPYESVVQDSHSLYLEVLGELGVVGLALLVLALAVPLVAAVRGAAPAARRPGRSRPMPRSSRTPPSTGTGSSPASPSWRSIAAVSRWSCLPAATTRTPSPAPRRASPCLPSPAALALLALAAVLATVPLSRARHGVQPARLRRRRQAQAQKASDWAPWSSEALDILGRAQLAQGQVVKARASFDEAVAKSPNDWELWRDLAAASPPAQARAALRRALALNPLETELKQLQAGARAEAVSTSARV